MCRPSCRRRCDDLEEPVKGLQIVCGGTQELRRDDVRGLKARGRNSTAGPHTISDEAVLGSLQFGSWCARQVTRSSVEPARSSGSSSRPRTIRGRLPRDRGRQVCGDRCVCRSVGRALRPFLRGRGTRWMLVYLRAGRRLSPWPTERKQSSRTFTIASATKCRSECPRSGFPYALALNKALTMLNQQFVVVTFKTVSVVKTAK